MTGSAGVENLRAYDDELRRQARLIAARFPGVSPAEAELRLRTETTRLMTLSAIPANPVAAA